MRVYRENIGYLENWKRFLSGSMVKNLPAVLERWIQPLVGQSPWGLRRVKQDLATKQQHHNVDGLHKFFQLLEERSVKSAWVAVKIKKYIISGGGVRVENNKNLFLTVLQAGTLRSRYQRNCEPQIFGT